MTTHSISPIRAFKDNYIWALIVGKSLCVVDPGDAQPVIDFAQQHDLQLETILITHHHNDHNGGVEHLRRIWPTANIFGPSTSISLSDTPVGEGDTVQWQNLNFKVFAVPGHTLDHIAFFCDDAALSQPILFCGDTLFAGGCGRIFEGTPEQMFNSLQRIASLPSNTIIYCAHEYTLSNLRFALAAEPNNHALQERMKHASKLQADNHPTVPSTLKIEKATNPFLRSHIPEIQRTVLQFAPKNLTLDSTHINPLTVFAVLREWKNQF